MPNYKAHINRHTPGGATEIRTVDFPWDGETPVTADTILKLVYGGQPAAILINQPPARHTNSDQWVFILDWPDRKPPEFVNVWIEDILPAYQIDLERREAARRIDQLGRAIKETELTLASQKFQYEQATGKYNDLTKPATPTA